MATKISELVEKYIKLRNAKKKLTDKYREDCGKIDDVLDKVEAVLLKSFKQLGVNNVSTEHGTAYQATRTSARVADWDAVLGFIQDRELWEFLDKRVNKTAVEAYKEEHGALPPGVTWDEEIVVNIRKS